MGWGCLERQSLESEAAIGGEAEAVLEVGPGAGQGAGQGLGPDMGPEELEGSEQHFKADPSAARGGRAGCGQADGPRALRRGLVTRCWGGGGALESTVGPAQVSCAAAPLEAVSCHSWGVGGPSQNLLLRKDWGEAWGPAWVPSPVCTPWCPWDRAM